MTDYSKMSDFEINEAVAEQLHKDRPSLIVKRDVPSRPAVTVFCDIGNGEIVSIVCADFCNNPAEAWPIIVEHSISVIMHDEYKGQPWFACKGRINATHANPLRAAMIVFLMMMEVVNV